jgi:hypothetical protein
VKIEELAPIVTEQMAALKDEIFERLGKILGFDNLTGEINQGTPPTDLNPDVGNVSDTGHTGNDKIPTGTPPTDITSGQVTREHLDTGHTQTHEDLTLQQLEASGPAPGLIEIGPDTTSAKALLNYYPRDMVPDGRSVEFIFDYAANRFIVGRPKDPRLSLESGHQSVVRLSGTNAAAVVGGMFIRTKDGGIRTTENSGHYGRFWTDEIRQQFVEFMRSKGVEIDHETWN